MKTPHDLRVLARQALARARDGEPDMRRYAHGLLTEARRRELTKHSRTAGRHNVTSDSYRAFLRHQLSTGGRHPSSTPTSEDPAV